MKRSRNEVARWRMQRQSQRRKSRWLEGQSRRYRHIYRIRAIHCLQQQRVSLFRVIHVW
ncbi:YciY family protein [Rouxiella badensis]|uniref:YciY family protein n=1 Tax=Rouxiella badensis TaxID=1646377 RepID=UPI000A310B2A|nr:YciY family protein [Rouxiella badensis]MCC3701470.1 YciY family protein [Rouxiella badensis]MCC3717897.1 YciY family protein [Rouxiella badensis]MCC3730088.1 YciY family protein [Rouxiella badensis]MCC3734203.1 YciY family protein [Rouxiella badensis]MCC3739240.1 YciY family protein [Rouxiella badensis]